MAKNTNAKTLKLVQTAVLVAMIVAAAFVPIRFSFAEITLTGIPIAFGAILLGPTYGAILGAAFGLTSYLQAVFTSPFGHYFFEINPFLMFIVCFVARVLAGWLAGWFYKALRGMGIKEFWRCGFTGLATALLNTVFFLTALLLFFGQTEQIVTMQAGRSLMAFVVAVFGLNCGLECLLGLIVGSAFANILPALRRRK